MEVDEQMDYDVFKRRHNPKQVFARSPFPDASALRGDYFLDGDDDVPKVDDCVVVYGRGVRIAYGWIRQVWWIDSRTCMFNIAWEPTNIGAMRMAIDASQTSD